MTDINALLAPISEEQPCGEDLAFSPELDAIGHAREYDDPTLDQGHWATELKEANWGFVINECAKLISKRSKDLRLAVWFAEASAKVNHFRGLGEGYMLLVGLCERYWETLHPLPDDGDQEQRIGNLSWLLLRSAQLVRDMPITEGQHTSYSTADYEGARLHAVDAEKYGAEARQIVGPSLTEVESAKHKSSVDFLENLLLDVQFCREALAHLEAAVDTRLGVDGPGFAAARDALDAVNRYVLPLIEQRSEVSGGGAHAEAVVGPDSSERTIHRPHLMDGPIQNRAQALLQLRLVADYFRKTEPHSPVAHLAEKAAAWGNLSLHDWLKQVVKDQGSLAHIEELLGTNEAN